MSDERPLGLLPAPAAAAPTAVAPVAPKATWQGEAVEEGVGELEDQAAMLAHTEQIRAQHLTDEQVGQLVRQTKSRTKAASTQAAPSASASTSKAPSSSSSSSSSSEESEESASSSDSG